MLDHRTETFMAVCSVMNYREAAELLHITPVSYTHLDVYKRQCYSCHDELEDHSFVATTPEEAYPVL